MSEKVEVEFTRIMFEALDHAAATSGLGHAGFVEQAVIAADQEGGAFDEFGGLELDDQEIQSGVAVALTLRAQEVLEARAQGSQGARNVLTRMAVRDAVAEAAMSDPYLKLLEASVNQVPRLSHESRLLPRPRTRGRH